MSDRKLANEFHKWMYEQYSARHGNLAGSLDEYGVYLVATPSSIPEKFFSTQKSGASEPLFIKLAEDLASRGLVRFSTDRTKSGRSNQAALCVWLRVSDIGKRQDISRVRAQRLADDSVSWLTGYFVGKRSKAA